MQAVEGKRKPTNKTSLQKQASTVQNGGFQAVTDLITPDFSHPEQLHVATESAGCTFLTS